MSLQFIVTVFYHNNNVRHFNYTDMLMACDKCKAFKGDRLARKVELSVVIHTWIGSGATSVG